MNARTDTRIAVIGAGLIGRKHIDIVSKVATLDAIVDPVPATEALAAEHGVPWYRDIAACLETHRPDGIIVASPNGLHLNHATACIEAGIPALIEKPLSDNASDALRIVELSEQAGVPLLVGHHRRHSPLVKTAKAAIESGRLGRIAVVQAQFWLHKPADYYDATWRRQKGGGPVYINLIHDIDLLRHFCGEIESVQAMETSAIRGFDVEDTAAVTLKFANGALGTVSISDTVSAPWSWELTAAENPAYPFTGMACYMLGGTHGSLSVPDLRLWHHPGVRSWWQPIEDTRLEADPLDPIDEQCRHFVEVIAGRAKPLVSAREGMRNIMVLDAIKQAALHGGTQKIGD